MSECGNVIYGLDTENGLQRISVDEALERYRRRPFYIQCEKCEGKLFPKCGNVRKHHFAHSFLRGAEDAPRKIENHSHIGGPSEWHKRWQRVFPEELRERKDPEYHLEDGRRADVMFAEEKIVIEFQKGEFGFDGSKDTCQKRNAFWSGQGYDIIWLFADTVSKEENVGFDLSANVVRIYRPYRDRLFGSDFQVTEHIEIHLIQGDFIYQLLPELPSNNENIATYPLVPSYLEKFNPEKEIHIPIEEVKALFLQARAEATERYFSNKTAPKLKNETDEKMIEIPHTREKSLRTEEEKSVADMEMESRINHKTLDEIVLWAKRHNLRIISVFNTSSGCFFSLYTDRQPEFGNMQGYLKRTLTRFNCNDRVEIYGRHQAIWQFLGK
jgi:hypothetical protein